MSEENSRKYSIDDPTVIRRYEKHGTASIPVSDLGISGEDGYAQLSIERLNAVKPVRYAWVSSARPRRIVLTSKDSDDVPKDRVIVDSDTLDILLARKTVHRSVKMKSTSDDWCVESREYLLLAYSQPAQSE